MRVVIVPLAPDNVGANSLVRGIEDALQLLVFGNSAIRFVHEQRRALLLDIAEDRR